MPRKKHDLEFQPERRRRKEMMGRFFIGFASIALLLVAASLVAVKNDDLLDKIIGAYFEKTTTATEEKEVWRYTGSATFLLCESDNAGQTLRFAALVRADMKRREFHIYPLLPETKAQLEGGEISLGQALREGGVKRLKDAVEALTEGPVDRYIGATDDNFMKAVNTMGAVTVDVPGRVVYKSASFGITLAQGTQRLQGDMLLRYMRYLGTLKRDAALRQGELLRLILETYLVPANAETPEFMERRFGNLVTMLETDISMKDFWAQRALLQMLLKESGKLNFDVREGDAPR